jgi:hypothetical protein
MLSGSTDVSGDMPKGSPKECFALTRVLPCPMKRMDAASTRRKRLFRPRKKTLLSIGFLLARNEEQANRPNITQKNASGASPRRVKKAPVEGNPTGAGNCKREKGG